MDILLLLLVITTRITGFDKPTIALPKQAGLAVSANWI